MILIIRLYVDDLVMIENNPKLFEEFKQAKAEEFEMTDIGLMSYYLGIEVKQGVMEFLFQKRGMLKRFSRKFKWRIASRRTLLLKVESSCVNLKREKKSIQHFLRAFFALLKVYILYRIGFISRFMEAPTTTHLKAAKRILRYISKVQLILEYFTHFPLHTNLLAIAIVNGPMMLMIERVLPDLCSSGEIMQFHCPLVWQNILHPLQALVMLFGLEDC